LAVPASTVCAKSKTEAALAWTALPLDVAKMVNRRAIRALDGERCKQEPRFMEESRAVRAFRAVKAVVALLNVEFEESEESEESEEFEESEESEEASE